MGIKKCKEDTELEKNIKLKLMIDNHQVGKFAEELEQKNDNLMKEYQVLRKTHEEENRIIKMNHENDIKRERSMINEVTLKVQTLEGDVKKAREWYTGRMKVNEKKVDEKEKERLDQIQIVVNKEGVIRELKEATQKKDREIKALTESVNKLENGKVSEIALKARQNVIEAQKVEINTLTADKKQLEKEVKGWKKQCAFFWEKDPKSVFVAGKKDTKEDRDIFIGKLEKMLKELKLENENSEPMLCDADMSAYSESSSFIDSGIRDNFSTTGALGDSEGMDTTMETSQDVGIESPKKQRNNNKRRK